MKSTTRKPRKVRTTLSITIEAQNVMLVHGYASSRTMGEFISKLIIDYHTQQTRKPTPADIAAELRRLADVLEQK